MNRIILIGNGFDLAHGLPTSYINFINDYWNNFVKAAGANTTSEYSQDDVVINFGPTFSNFKSDVTSYDYWNYSLLKDKVDKYSTMAEQFHQRVDFTIRNAFQKRISETARLTSWVDIENEYNSCLIEIQKRLHRTYNTDAIRRDIQKLNKEFQKIKLLLEKYLQNVVESSNITRNNTISQLIYSPFLTKEFTEDAKNKIAKHEFSKIQNYINYGPGSEGSEIAKETRQFIDSYNNVDERAILNDLLDNELATKRFNLTPVNYLFLNFNYTSSEQIYIENKNDNITSIHIHGELGNTKNPMIFGYGDELEENYKQIENLNINDFLENIKSINYLNTDNYKKLLSFIDDDLYQIIILGHSCGNSDRTLLNTLFEHKNCVSIKPYYFVEEKGETKTDNYSDIVRNISRNFTDKRSMRDKVVNKTYSTPFSTNTLPS